MEGFMAFVAWTALVFVAAAALGATSMKGTLMEKAFEQGHAVQCLGQSGYHFNCDEEKDN